MLNLDPGQLSDYLKRSYTAVDGLWFMKTEEAFSFDTALDIDDMVWKVMPKIQARKLKSFATPGRDIDMLRECFETKLLLDGFTFDIVFGEISFDVLIAHCPWYDMLVKSNRQHLAVKIGSRICATEYSGWGAEFGCAFSFIGSEKKCAGCETCGLRFDTKKAAD